MDASIALASASNPASTRKRTIFVDTNIIVGYETKDTGLPLSLFDSSVYDLYYTNTVRDERKGKFIPEIFHYVPLPQTDMNRVEKAAREIMSLTSLQPNGTNYKHTLNDIKILLEAGFMYWNVANIDENVEPLLISNNMNLYRKLYKEKYEQIEEIVNNYGLEHIAELKLPSMI